MNKTAFPPLNQQIEETTHGLHASPFFDQSSGPLKTVVSPYRICPIGAHIDHQGGPVLGVAIDAYSVLSFAPTNDGQIYLTSNDFAEPISFPAHRIPEKKLDWARYARGAVAALHQQFPDQVTNGFVGHISGRLLGAGLSSSASAGVAYLQAIAHVNDLALRKPELVELDRLIENEYLGLNNGIQDQTTIIFAGGSYLIHQNTRERIVTEIEHPANINDVAWLVIFSGYTRELTSSGFNDRVAECWQAAKLLDPAAKILDDAAEEIFLKKKDSLPPDLQRRAAHFFTERNRVEDGARVWAAGDFEKFGALMNQSCHSSIHQYECGSAPLIELHKIALKTEGILGSRFSGGGYGGCLVALAQNNQAPSAIKSILAEYKTQYPEKADVCNGWIANGVNGAHIVDLERE